MLFFLKEMSGCETLVVNVRAQNIRPRYSNLQEWMDDPKNSYIGRGGTVLIGSSSFSYPGSKWGNPFKPLKHNTKEQRIRQYEAYIRQKIESESLQKELLAMKGKVLGCWCKPDGCHGDVLVRLIEELGYLEASEPKLENDGAKIKSSTGPST
jgi:hypothetical protein